MTDMHIGIDARFAGVAQGGIGRYAEEAVKALGRMREEFSVSLFVRRANWDLCALDNRFHKIFADVPWYGLREQIEMPRLFRRAHCDLYHVPHFNVPLRMPHPFVFTLHDVIMWERGSERDTTRIPLVSAIKEQGMKMAVRHALKHCEACIVPSQWVADRIAPVAGIRPKRVEVIHEGAESLSRAQETEWHTQAGRFSFPSSFVLTVGNVYRHKNIPVVIDAVALLREKCPALHHVHAGPAHPKKFSEDLARYGKEKFGARFHYLTHVSDGELATLYRHAQALVAPSAAEGFALPALEAMSLGCPVIAARAHCFPELLGDAARFVRVNDARALADAIEELLTDEGKRAEFSERGTLHAAKYTWEKHVRGLLSVYSSLLRNK